VAPNRAANLHLAKTTSLQLPTPLSERTPTTHSLFTADNSLSITSDAMVEDNIFQTQTHPDSASFRTLSTDKQVKHLLHLLIDARKVVFSLQSTEGIADAQIPPIFNALNSITSPITQLPLETTLDHQNKLQKELAAVKANMEALSTQNTFMLESLTTQNTHISEELAITLRCIKDMNARVSNLEQPTFSKITSTIPIPSLPTPTTPPQLPKPKAQIKLPTLPPPSNSHHPSRLVIQFPPDGLRKQDRKDPQAIVKAVNGALEKNPKSRHLRVVAAKFSVQGNLVLSTRADQTASELIKAADVFTPIVNPKNLPIALREDKKWYKIQVDGVSTTTYAHDGTGTTHNSDSIHKELILCNPSYAAASPHIVAPPRWMRTYEELRSVPRSSFVFAIDNETLAKSILQSRSLAVFGRHCSLCAYQDRPPVTQCKHCWGWNHKAEICKKTRTCRLCSQEHSEANHTEPECPTCKSMDEGGDTTMKDGPSCLHNLKCANCINAGLEDVSHAADAR